MDTILNGFAVLLTGLAACVVVMNYAYVTMSYRNRLRGIDRHYSTVPLAAQILLVVADRASSIASKRVLPWPWLLGLALVDISLWFLLLAPFRLLLRRR